MTKFRSRKRMEYLNERSGLAITLTLNSKAAIKVTIAAAVKVKVVRGQVVVVQVAMRERAEKRNVIVDQIGRLVSYILLKYIFLQLLSSYAGRY